MTDRGDRVLPLLLYGVAFAAGLTGLVLLAFPGSTPRYFSWGLAPAPLASLIGGSYLASLVVFGLAARRPWLEVRGLVAGTLFLTLPMLVVSWLHVEEFDLGRPQAVGWFALFTASPIAFGTVLWTRRSIRSAAPRDLASWVRVAAGLLSLALFGLAAWLWIAPTTVSVLPFELPPLGGRVLGCWCSFLGFLAAWSALRGRGDEARIPLLGLAVFGGGAVISAVRSLAAGQI